MDDKEESGHEQKEVCENAEVNTYEKHLFSNKINSRRTSKSKKTFSVDELQSDSKENNMNISSSKNETSTEAFRNEVLGNQVGCVRTTKESAISQREEVVSSTESLTIENDQFGTEMTPNGNLKTAACNTTLTVTSEKEKQGPPAFESIIDDELKQLVAYILNKRQLKGVEVRFLRIMKNFCFFT